MDINGLKESNANIKNQKKINIQSFSLYLIRIELFVITHNMSF